VRKILYVIRDQSVRPFRAISDISHCGKPPPISGQSTEVRRGILYRGEHRQAAKRAAADIEGHSTAAKFGQPGRLSASVYVRLKRQLRRLPDF
jgi:hypothetical protein